MPYEALKSGTANVGVYFGTQWTVGTVTAGKRADLILLEANPLTNIANVRGSLASWSTGGGCRGPTSTRGSLGESKLGRC
jgi:hypothetical protein